LKYISDNRQPGDLTYVYHNQLESFLYYAPKYGFSPSDYVIGTNKRDGWKENENWAYKRELDTLHGNPRVWALFSHVRSVNGVSEEKYLVEYLSTVGRKLDQFKSDTAAGYLFDLGSDWAPTSE
jgi:hypothetical protein